MTKADRDELKADNSGLKNIKLDLVLHDGINDVDDGIKSLDDGIGDVDDGIDGMEYCIDGVNDGIKSLDDCIDGVDDAIGGHNVGVVDAGARILRHHLHHAALEHLCGNLLAASGLLDLPADALVEHGPGQHVT